MCVNLKTFHESFRQWAEQREEEFPLAEMYAENLAATSEEELLPTNLDKEKSHPLSEKTKKQQ